MKKGKELDITVICIYPPPITGDKSEKKVAMTAAKMTVIWALRELNRAKSRTMPVLLGDMQQKFGITDGERWPGHGEYWIKERGKLDIDKIWETFFYEENFSNVSSFFQKSGQRAAQKSTKSSPICGMNLAYSIG